MTAPGGDPVLDPLWAAPTWGVLRRAVQTALARGGVAHAEQEATWILERASGLSAAELVAAADDAPGPRPVAASVQMVEHRRAGAPLAYALGAWSFRGLDLLVDARVLVPRPETEVVAEVAIEAAVGRGLRRDPRKAGRATVGTRPLVDLGTGSGAIALALAAELPDAAVWAVDRSPDALAVARANVAGAGAARVRLVEGSWFDALPSDLRGRITVAVANPPYIAEHEVPDLPPEVARWEPREALVSGPTGLEDLTAIIEAAPAWLEPGGALVCELAPHQSDDVRALATAAGFARVDVRPDLAGRARALLAELA